MIIGLIGPAGVGKTTIASGLVELYGFRRLPFAAPLKHMLGSIGIPPANLYGDKKEEPLDVLCGKSAREAMQTLGTEWGRHCVGEDFWVRVWCAQVKSGDKVVVDDVRFPNECQAIRKRGGLIVRVDRPGFQSVAPSHLSERSDELFADYTARNETGNIDAATEAVLNFALGYTYGLKTLETT